VLEEVYDIWLTSFWQTDAFYAILGILGISGFILSFLLWFWLRRKAPTKRMLKARIISRLDKLLKKQNCSKQYGKDDYKSIYSELTYLLKEFFLLTVNNLSQGMTDSDMLDNISKMAQPKVAQALQAVLQRAGRIKFASGHDESMNGKQVCEDINTVLSFVTSLQEQDSIKR
jgi:hypothetical protein